jgi:hypothetical protein
MKKIILIILLFGVTQAQVNKKKLRNNLTRLRERIISVFKRKRYNK